MADLDESLFLLLNASARPTEWIVEGVAGLANSPVALAPLIVVALWIWGTPSRRGGLIAVAAAVLAAQCVNLTLGLLWFEPRPFMVPIGHTLVAHVADNGFPSDHATLVWTLGAGLWLTGSAPRWGAAVCLYGVVIAWSRIWLGVHFPDDMLASAIVGAVMGGCAVAVTPVAGRSILPFVESAYERAVSALRLPARLVPRRPSD